MILIFVGAYYASKLLGRTYSINAPSSGGMRIIDRMQLGRDRYLLIVEAGGKVLLLGVGGQRIDSLAELDKEKFDHQPASQGSTDFLSLFKNRIKKHDDREG
jgi:flagellar biogenesis protein FliO